MGRLGDAYEKTYAHLILNFALIKKFDIYDKITVVGLSFLLLIV